MKGILVTDITQYVLKLYVPLVDSSHTSYPTLTLPHCLPLSPSHPHPLHPTLTITPSPTASHSHFHTLTHSIPLSPSHPYPLHPSHHHTLTHCLPLSLIPSHRHLTLTVTPSHPHTITPPPRHSCHRGHVCNSFPDPTGPRGSQAPGLE